MSKSIHKKAGIYIHIPYCVKKCNYCAFNSFAQSDVPGAYLKALMKEIRWKVSLFNVEEKSIDTIYFGGGTPSLLDAEEVEELIATVSASCNLEGDAEITLEINPATRHEARIKGFRRAGVNRLSIGIQSFDDENLKFLGRLHSGADAEATFSAARDAGFENISMDIMCGMPGQKAEDLLADLERVAILGPEHISIYLLSVEEGTPLEKAAEKGTFIPAHESLEEQLLCEAGRFLTSRGYRRYETSNYALKGFESRHNMSYWQGGDYLGVGAGAHSYLSEIGWGMRQWNVREPGGYIEAVEKGGLPLDGLELLTRREAIRETVLTSLRTSSGLTEGMLMDKYGITLSQALDRAALDHLPGDLCRSGEGRIVLTEKGALMTDEIAARISI